MENVIGYHNVSKEVENVVRSGPSSTSVDEFLQCLNSIESAIKYFEANNPQSVELENLVSLQKSN